MLAALQLILDVEDSQVKTVLTSMVKIWWPEGARRQFAHVVTTFARYALMKKSSH